MAEVGISGAAGKYSCWVWNGLVRLVFFPQRQEQHPALMGVDGRESPKAERKARGSEFRWPKVGERRSEAEMGGGETEAARAKEAGSGMLGRGGEERWAVGTPE